ncbi:MAG: CCA tRNA nucleotidyltransferase [Lachnospiraceae bacterium]|nr:CCA tRNA nucleotidyltransferase [Lachnospiraceae bacterium]
MPKHVKYIINTLEKNGYEAYAVGGCVRDAIIGKEPNDWDITTNATPMQVKKLFKHTIDTGIQHGTVTIMIDKVGYEVTTYRIDGKYADGRHPDKVEFTVSLKEDLKRRDFTINAMAYNDTKGIIDLFGGIEDLKEGIVKCVGNPYNRFDEDALRILRAFRFAAVLNFEVEEKTKKAAGDLAENLNKISKERIRTELDKLIMSDTPEKLMEARKCGLLKYILSEVEDDINIELVKAMPKNNYMKWAALLYHREEEEVSKILKKLKFDNKTVNICKRIVGYSKDFRNIYKENVRVAAHEVGVDIFDKFLEFSKVCINLQDWKGGEYPDNSDYINNIEHLYKKVIDDGDCLSLKELAVKGGDLMEIGVPKGAKLGEILNILLYKVLDNPKYNNREKLLEIAGNIINNE